VSADAVAREIYRHIPRLATKRKLDPSLLYAALLAMPIDWQLPDAYESRREEALARIGSRDPDDWPTLALTLEAPVWSQDKDF
jgi:predicted nucleic acid-binding protein